MKVETVKKILFGVSGGLFGIVVFLYIGPQTKDIAVVNSAEKMKHMKIEDLDIHDDLDSIDNNYEYYEENESLENLLNKKSYHRFLIEDLRLVGRNEPNRYAKIKVKEEDEDEKEETERPNKETNNNQEVIDGSEVGIEDLDDVKPIDKPNKDKTKPNRPNEDVEEPTKEPNRPTKEPDKPIDKPDTNTPSNGVLAYDPDSKKIVSVEIGRIENDLKQDGFYPVNKAKSKYADLFGKTNNGFHTGIDITGDIKGSEVYNISNGAVERIVYGEGKNTYGNLVVINHGNFKSYYGSLEGFARNLKVGQIVKAGELIGYVGNTGKDKNTTRLHFEIEQNGIKIDPKHFLDNVISKGINNNSNNNLDVELNKM